MKEDFTMKKLLGILLALTLVVSMAVCANADEPVKTGLYLATSVSGSTSATAEKDGCGYSYAHMVAVAVDANGVIVDCAIDMVQAKVTFNAAGELTLAEGTTFPTKQELGDDYGMRKASSIGKEMNEQLDGLAAYCIGKTVEELKGIALDEKGKATDADLLASITLSISSELDNIIAAVESAEDRGAQKGDKLVLVSVTEPHSCKSATDEKNGNAQADTTAAVVTMNGDVITSCYIDAIQPKVAFDKTGTITSDIEAAVVTKNALGAGYGMGGISAIGKEWNEQAAAFSAYVTGKTAADITGMTLESGKATDADLLAGCTIGITSFVELIAKAAQ